MVTVDVVYQLSKDGLRAQTSWLGPKVGGHLCSVLHYSCELGTLLQWLCHDDNIMNTVPGIIIIINKYADIVVVL